jgi:hypothetical protein
MKRIFSSYWPVVLFALAGTPTISAQRAWMARSNIPLTQGQAKPHTTTGTTPTLPIISPGSSLTFTGTNAPDTYSAMTTFSSTPVTVDSGAVKIWQQQVVTGTTGEWDIFYMQPTDNGPLANNINADWAITIAFTLNWPVYNDGVVTQWLVNGTAVGPLTNGIGTICCAASSNPVLPGYSYYNSGNGALPAGLQSNWQEIYVDPYSYVTAGGIDASTANEFVFALHFSLQGPTPTVGGVVSASAFWGIPHFRARLVDRNLRNESGRVHTKLGHHRFQRRRRAYHAGGNHRHHRGQMAFIDYVSQGQVNVQVPGTVEHGLATAGGYHESMALFFIRGPSAAASGVTVNLESSGSHLCVGPYPTDVLTTPDSTQKNGMRINLPMPDCTTAPSDCQDVQLINQLDGFQTVPRITVNFSGPIDVNSVHHAIYYVALDNLTQEEHGINYTGQMLYTTQMIYDPTTNTLYGKPDGNLDQHRQYRDRGDRRRSATWRATRCRRTPDIRLACSRAWARQNAIATELSQAVSSVAAQLAPANIVGASPYSPP